MKNWMVTFSSCPQSVVSAAAAGGNGFDGGCSFAVAVGSGGDGGSRYICCCSCFRC